MSITKRTIPGKWEDKKWYEPFIGELKKTRGMSTAAKKLGLTMTTVYRYRKEDSLFAQMIQDAIRENDEDLEQSALSKAIDGWLEPVYYQGKRCGWVRKYSIPLIIFMLKTRLPDKYNIDRP